MHIWREPLFTIIGTDCSKRSNSKFYKYIQYIDFYIIYTIFNSHTEAKRAHTRCSILDKNVHVFISLLLLLFGQNRTMVRSQDTQKHPNMGGQHVIQALSAICPQFYL